MAAARIRPMRTDDAEAVAHLTTQLGYPVGTDAQLRRIAAVLADPEDHVAFVAVNGDDRPIGWVHVERLRFLEGDAAADLMGLVVDEAHRSEAVGAQLLAAAETWARAVGARRIMLRSRVTRKRAHHFYERHGYVVEKTSYVFRKALET